MTKQQERSALAADVQKYLSAGGEITQIHLTEEEYFARIKRIIKYSFSEVVRDNYRKPNIESKHGDITYPTNTEKTAS